MPEKLRTSRTDVTRPRHGESLDGCPFASASARNTAMLLLSLFCGAALQPPVASSSLASHVWTSDMLSSDEAAAMREKVLTANSYPCPLQEASWPRKRCTKITMSTLAPLDARLAELWPSLNRSALTNIAASIDMPSDDASPRHHTHRDVFPEREASARGPDATAVLYLSEAPTSHPAELSAPTLFPRHGLRIVPKAGRLLLWRNLLEDGAPDPNAEHGVGPYVGEELPPRVALHLPISEAAAQGEHVGCGGGAMHHHIRIMQHRAEILTRWLNLMRRLVVSWEEAQVRRLRAVGRLAGTLVRLQIECAERIYAPGGLGYTQAQEEFERLAGSLPLSSAREVEPTAYDAPTPPVDEPAVAAAPPHALSTLVTLAGLVVTAAAALVRKLARGRAPSAPPCSSPGALPVVYSRSRSSRPFVARSRRQERARAVRTMRAQLLAAEGSAAPPRLVALTSEKARRLFVWSTAGYGTHGPLRILHGNGKRKIVEVEEDQLVNEMRTRLVFERIQRHDELEDDNGFLEAMGLGFMHAMGGM